MFGRMLKVSLSDLLLDRRRSSYVFYNIEDQPSPAATLQACLDALAGQLSTDEAHVAEVAAGRPRRGAGGDRGRHLDPLPDIPQIGGAPAGLRGKNSPVGHL
ncbi:hypothetical protein BB934_33190 (plasmid) [Microvirga ossetica]|uniref:Uncharacterized protein n=1 Tax=Microvirga ossetica TaxID=1882682 RepID=A0A1B2ESV6_9HYPH|nr:hypothetical protein BB934_33190 [Microvirga ossetica]